MLFVRLNIKFHYVLLQQAFFNFSVMIFVIYFKGLALLTKNSKNTSDPGRFHILETLSFSS